MGFLIHKYLSILPIDKLAGLCYNGRTGRLVRGRPDKNPALIVGRVAGIFRVGFPHTAALLGLPAKGATGSGKILSSDLSGLLGLSVANFVVEHFDYLSFICAFIIAYLWGFVNPQFDFYLWM